ncbi:MAG: UDP-glucuronic acid decarboxylase family protein [Devosia sp.]
MRAPMENRILVTGGAGFIGSHLCARLLDAGSTVICLDNFQTGSRRNIEPLLSRPGFTVVTHDVTVPLTADVDAIYNLACPASPPHYQADPIRTMKTSVLGALNVLDLAHQRGIPVLQASTSEVYGDPDVHPQPETYWGHVNPTGPRACYDEGKRAAETLFFDYHRERGTAIKVARIFNTYGPHMDPGDGRVVSNFINQALSGEDITIFGDGSQTRSFCYVDDLVDGLIRMMQAPADTTGPINLGNPDEYTIRQLAELIIELTKSRSRVVQRDLPIDDPQRRQPDIALARRHLGWEPTVPVREGLLRTIDYFAGLTRLQPALAI